MQKLHARRHLTQISPALSPEEALEYLRHLPRPSPTVLPPITSVKPPGCPDCWGIPIDSGYGYLDASHGNPLEPRPDNVSASTASLLPANNASHTEQASPPPIPSPNLADPSTPRTQQQARDEDDEPTDGESGYDYSTSEQHDRYEPKLKKRAKHRKHFATARAAESPGGELETTSYHANDQHRQAEQQQQADHDQRIQAEQAQLAHQDSMLGPQGVQDGDLVSGDAEDVMQEAYEYDRRNDRDARPLPTPVPEAAGP